MLLRHFFLIALLQLTGCANVRKSAYYPSELRTSVAEGFDDHGRYRATTTTVELRWPLRPPPPPVYIVLPARELPAPTRIYPEPPCSTPRP